MQTGRVGGRNKDHRHVGLGVLDRLGHRVEDRDAFDVDAAFAGGYPGHDVGAVLAALLGVEQAAAAGNALDKYSGLLIEQYGHEFSP